MSIRPRLAAPKRNAGSGSVTRVRYLLQQKAAGTSNPSRFRRVLRSAAVHGCPAFEKTNEHLQSNATMRETDAEMMPDAVIQKPCLIGLIALFCVVAQCATNVRAGFQRFSDPQSQLETSSANAFGKTFQFKTRESSLEEWNVQDPGEGHRVAEFSARNGAETEWLAAAPAGKHGPRMQLGSRVLVSAKKKKDLTEALAGLEPTFLREIRPHWYLFHANNALHACHLSSILSTHSKITFCRPVRRIDAQLDAAYAPFPNDPYFEYDSEGSVVEQWYLENRFPDGNRAGLDLNARSAWAVSQGEGVTVAVADAGLQLDHPDLMRGAVGPHKNFMDTNAPAGPINGGLNLQTHGTGVAGLIAATQGNRRGMIGVAPRSNLASWVIFDSTGVLADEVALMEMFQFASDRVAVQNHSWGDRSTQLVAPSVLERLAILDAVQEGRDGRGVVMVRSAGNNRASGGNANDNGYRNDPNVIAVGAVNDHGRVLLNSNPGACLLVAAPGRDSQGNGLFTTDLVGTGGRNQFPFLPPHEELSDYRFNSLGFGDTSAAASLISGVTALLLSVRPELTVRDVQQVLVLSSHHWDRQDPLLATNGVGLEISPNVGFGIPDAGKAVRSAQKWPLRPVLETRRYPVEEQATIPDAGFRLNVTGGTPPEELANIPALPGMGVFPLEPMASTPLVFAGKATDLREENLEGKGALIQRNGSDWSAALAQAAEAGAVFGVIFNSEEGAEGCPGGDTLCPMIGTDFVPMPTAFIGHTAGQSLVERLQQGEALQGKLKVEPLVYPLPVEDSLSLEHVALRVKTNHPLRGDLRITLTSPMGTTSVLQTLGEDTNAGPEDWIYTTTHHFYESSAGIWKISFSDLFSDNQGSVLSLELILRGTSIEDADRDGLDDNWELGFWENLAKQPYEDSDKDGSTNLREWLMESDPTKVERILKLHLSIWKPGRMRLSWPALPDHIYDLLGRWRIQGRESLVDSLQGAGEMELFLPLEDGLRFFRVKEKPPRAASRR